VDAYGNRAAAPEMTNASGRVPGPASSA